MTIKQAESASVVKAYRAMLQVTGLSHFFICNVLRSPECYVPNPDLFSDRVCEIIREDIAKEFRKRGRPFGKWNALWDITPKDMKKRIAFIRRMIKKRTPRKTSRRKS